MNTIIINSGLVMLTCKRSDFEGRSKTAEIDNILIHRIKELFDKCGSDELTIMLRRKESGSVELVPTEKVYTHGKGIGELIPIEELRPRFEPAMSSEEFLKSLNQEKSESELPKQDSKKDNTKIFEGIERKIINTINKYKENGMEFTNSHKKKLKEKVNELLYEKEILESEFWSWYSERRKSKSKQQQITKLKNIASILGTTLIKTADFLTELNPDEEKPVLNEETNEEGIVDKSITDEGRQVFTVSNKDDTEKKTYDQNNPELQNIIKDLSPIIAFTTEQRTVLAELGYTI